MDTYLFYSYPNSVFAFQGGEPTLAGLPSSKSWWSSRSSTAATARRVSNALQTNARAARRALVRPVPGSINWLVGVSLDGPEEIHDLYRFNKEGQRHLEARDARASRLLQKNGVEFNMLCVLSQANVEKPRELYTLLPRPGHRQHAVHSAGGVRRPTGNRLPFTITPEQYGRFLCEIFDLWWPERRKVRIRFFDNIAEALAGQKPGTCTMHETCDSYVVVEYNGDVYPCDFFVEKRLEAGQRRLWIPGRRSRAAAALPASPRRRPSPHPECQVCEYQSICHGGCPKFRHGPHRQLRRPGLLLRRLQDDLRQGRSTAEEGGAEDHGTS